MIDLETLATAKDAAICEIAAVFFVTGTNRTAAVFQAAIEPALDPRPGAIELATMNWAQEHGTYPHDIETEALDTREACVRFERWVKDGVEELGIEMDELEVWAWGMDFDFPVLGAAFWRSGMVLPWRYKQQNDARTVWKLAFPGEWPKERPHKALEDCLGAINDLRAAIEHLEGGGHGR